MRILVVEDHPAMADALQRGLGGEGFDVDVAANGTDGLWRAQEFPYDAIVLDIMLPGINGYQVCRTLRTAGNTTPILMLTAKDGEYDIAEGLDFGADDYLTKPFSFVVLVARLRVMTRRANPTPGHEVIRVGPLTIDTATRRCSIGEALLDFTVREYSLLEALARQPGMPLTRQHLMDHVWGADHPGTSNVVDVYVGYLRRKLGAGSAGSDQMVETVRGIGYRLIAP